MNERGCESTESPEPLPELFTATEWAALAKAADLTTRQIQVARLICRGYRKDAIAQALGIKSNTVRMHANDLYRRLNVHDRVGVVVRLVLVHRKAKRH